MAEWYIERTDKIVSLSDEQKQKIKAEYESRDKATKEFQTSIEAKAKSVTVEMTEAFKSQDKDAIAKSQKAYQELYAPLFELTKKSEAALQSILTAEQRTKLSDNQFATMLTALAPGVELSDAQRREIKAAFGQSAGEYEANGRDAKGLDRGACRSQKWPHILVRPAVRCCVYQKLDADVLQVESPCSGEIR